MSQPSDATITATTASFDSLQPTGIQLFLHQFSLLILVSFGVIIFLIYKNRVKKREKQTIAPTPSSSIPSGGLDMRKLSKFIMWIGILVFAYGFIQFATNNQKQFLPDIPLGVPSQSTLEALNRSVQVQDEKDKNERENIVREEAQESAKKIMIVGVVVLVVGIGISTSIKK